MSEAFPIAERPLLEGGHLEELKLAATKMSGAERRSFQAGMGRKYCGSSPRQAEVMFGGNRHTVEGGLHEPRTGRIGLGAHEAFCGNKRWEDRHPQVAEALWVLAESPAQPDPSFHTPLAYTRLTAVEALKQLRDPGFAEDVLPSPSTMADVLNRNGYRLRPVVKAKPQKIPETDAIFDKIQAKDPGGAEGTVVRLSRDCKATVQIGEYSRGGQTRGDNQAVDPDRLLFFRR